MTQTVIAVPEQAFASAYIGKLRPLFRVDGPLDLVPVDPADYPNQGLVFMPTAFQQLTRDFPLLQSLVAIQIEANREPTLDPTDPNFAKYITVRGEQPWREPGTWQIQHVIDAPFDPADRTIVLPVSTRHPVWLRDYAAGRVYGPFDVASSASEEGKIVVRLSAPAVIPWISDADRPDFGVLSLPLGAIEPVEVPGSALPVAINVHHHATPDAGEWVDFMPDESLVNWVRARLGSDSESFNKRAADAVKHLIRENALVEGPFDEDRIERAAAILDQVVQWDDQRTRLLDAYFDTPHGKERFDAYFREHAQELLRNSITFSHPGLLDAVYKVTREIAVLQRDRDDLVAKIEEARAGFDEDALIAKREQFEERIRVHTDELNSVLHRIGMANDIETLDARHQELMLSVEDLQSERASLERETAELTPMVERLRAQADENLDSLRARLTELKPFVDSLTGAAASTRTVRTLAQPSIATDVPDDLRAFGQRVHQGTLKQGHQVPYEQVANTLAATLTSRLTILAGLPGVGKTSLVTRMARAAGLQDQSQFLAINVPRGWRTQADLVGFHNPITGDFEAAPTGMYPLLRFHDHDASEPLPSWVLFDEANLSPPEHYLSSFLGLMDDGDQHRLESGRPGETLTLSPAMRFLFTINQDASTEPLTPRMIDRAAVVYIAPPDAYDDAHPEEALTPPPTLTQAMIDRLLEPISTQYTDAEWAILTGLVDALQDDADELGVMTYASPRKLKRLRRHTTTLRALLGVQAGLTALDYAVAGHVLPLIRGSGSGYETRLSRVARQLESLPVSRRLLRRIVDAGKASFGEFSFQTIA